ncbi:FYVE, RhoGEF and PH domain-containing protein 4-like [Ruditapes philippinarum]|uniref:FYVE, RhoGEF and PH domain-containing protein 4-like n=1 Tax=Ruditapes philippinarum TaxID=129788 RepID=UPI00295AB1AA|nr:FYVE, RhoGEF and PH domain-containing protein 4-like [Ruditapes philippinarum]
MGQEVSLYTENFPNIAVVPNFQQLLPHLQRIKPKLRFNREGFDLERELRKWLTLSKNGAQDQPEDECSNESINEGSNEVESDKEGDEAKTEGETYQLRVYQHYRTNIGSPSIYRRSFTQDEIKRFVEENDGFPLPSTNEEIKAFDQQAFIDQSQSCGKGGVQKRSKKRDRQRSKSATSVPDLGTIRLKLQKIQSPGKPKFIEHLINRVVSKRVSRRNSNGLNTTNEEPVEVPEEPLSPDSEKCLQQAEAIVEELLSCSNRPASGESTDSGKGSSLLESTSDFSPTSKRKSWSTPASPTFHGLVKERLKSFQALNESSDTDSVCSQPGSHSPLQKQKTFRNEEFDQEIREINKNIKQFYCSDSQDESFNTAVMEEGYVKALVAKINENKLKPEPAKSVSSESEHLENGEAISEDAKLKLDIDPEDSGWNEWVQEVGDDNDGTGEEVEEITTVEKRISNISTASDKRTSGSLESSDVRSKLTRHSTSDRSSNTSSGSSSSRANSQTNSVSDSDNHSAGQTGSTEKRGCVSQSFDYGLLPLNPAELFDENWSKCELSFEDFDCDFDSLSDSKKKEEEEKPKDKLHQIAHELLTTERAYVARLNLIDQTFHFRVTMESKNGNFLPADDINTMFANIKPICLFHKDFLLPQLEDRMQHWSSSQRIGDVMAKLAPFLKIYTEYVKNYDKAMAMIDKWTSQSPRFATLLQDIKYVLNYYLKRLPQDSPDRPDAQKALDLVTEAASHSNTAMKKLDKFHKLLNIIPRLNGEGTNDLVSPTRELVKEGPITKISARSGEKQARYIFLFNDLLLVCSEQMMGSYKLRARLSVDGMEITAGDNQTIQNTFCVKCIEKTVEFLDEANSGQGLDWFATFQQVVTDYHHKSKLCRVKSDPGPPNPVADNHPDLESTVSLGLSTSMSSLFTTSLPAKNLGNQLGQKSPQWVKDEEVTMCMSCQDKFTAIKRRHHCRACGKVFCNKCSSKKVQLAYDSNQMNRVCQKCYDILKKGKGSVSSLELSTEVTPISPKPAIQIHKADEASILSGYLNVMDKDHKWTKKWITVHDDFALYFYKKHKDVAAIQTLPLPGHSVKVIGDSADRPNVFSLTHKDINVCFFQADSEIQFTQWVRVLEKMVILELPTDEEKRTSTHSDSSGQSNSSGSSGHSI